MLDAATGLCRGVAFVNYCDADAAARAAGAMNNAIVGGRRLHVAVQAPRRGGGGAHGSAHGSAHGAPGGAPDGGDGGGAAAGAAAQ